MLGGKTLCKVWNQKNTGAKSQRRGRLISLIFIFYLQSHILSAKFMDLREIKRIKGGLLLTKI